MIAFLQGKVAWLEPAEVVINCQGVGYACRISLNTYLAIKDQTELLLHTHLQVKEDAHTLYGFARPDERALFIQLLGVSGVGGSTALMMLSGMTVAELQATIQANDVAGLKKLKGVGEKTASRIILELQNKLPSLHDGPVPGTSLRQDALQALVSLGFPKQEMEKRLDRILKEQAIADAETLIKLALRG
ncbi:MAG: Holliday junction branch migration protein RuvA [Bacteroidetes bacterium]|jgi:Holliday junction DNA helicase RuvA|nr:Holliday junction branch migration protein RuvA [Bacteroidota bacterium]